MERFLQSAAKPISDASKESSRCERRQQQQEQNVVLEYEQTGRMHKRLHHLCTTSVMKSYALVECLEQDNYLPPSMSRQSYVSDIEFNTEGTLVAFTTSTGYMNIHAYDSILSGKRMPPVAAYSLCGKLQAVRWNPLDQLQVACVAESVGSVIIFDVRHRQPESLEKMQVFRTKPGTETHRGLYDVQCKSWKIFACASGGVYVWDRRAGNLSTATLRAPSFAGTMLSLDITSDEQVLLAGSSSGHIFAWDIRGGKASSCSAFSSPNNVDQHPLGIISMSTALQEIPDLRVDFLLLLLMLAIILLFQSQTYTGDLSVTCVRLNSSGDQLAFGLNKGWSGVINMLNFQEITHIHCPPSLWELGSLSWLSTTKLTWLLSLPVVAVASGDLRFLEFSGPGSRHHVSSRNNGCAPVVIEMADGVYSVAAHPSDGCLMVGTQEHTHLVAHDKQFSS
ncbi:uncharacterized protein LOC112343074 isoform X1 [Selaginella moellendorffii]|uniref:uncharacterized protein LOC112343074 isoform X1 n=1 Tax=Selaginella moellendorffii TaxID=88036 RepID=UPI000D1CE592|nr:uncharacterized protein LOC112343074 isoform X1 [Selaginella moellendorffii]|eukprot:XP_024521731.1 uncharacterized protein LOC112343074 isoform X1 [Selaginella moellendorffii]